MWWWAWLTAWAGDLPLVPSAAGHREVRATLALNGADVPVDAFLDALVDCKQIPLSASYLGVPALTDCRDLGRRDGYVIQYQRTGGNAVVRPRHYVIAFQVTTRTADRGVLRWRLVEHTRGASGWEGPYAPMLNAFPSAVLTPYNEGSWEIDRTAGVIRYHAVSDPGGTVPSWMVSQAAVLAFPKELLRVRFGVAL